MDDMLVAHVALQEAAAAAAAGAPVQQTLDLGCGIGSVLLMVAWGLRRQHMEAAQQQQAQHLLQDFGVTSLGVEAQQVSVDLARRSVQHNLGPGGGGVQVRQAAWHAAPMQCAARLLARAARAAARMPCCLGAVARLTVLCGCRCRCRRCQVLHHDLRQPLPGPGGQQRFDLITGTPPYIPAVRMLLGAACAGAGAAGVTFCCRNNSAHQDCPNTPTPVTIAAACALQGAGGRSLHPQQLQCCNETRGGIESYCAAAAAALAPSGRFVVCAGLNGQPAVFKGRRAALAAAAAGLVIVRQVTRVCCRCCCVLHCCVQLRCCCTAATCCNNMAGDGRHTRDEATTFRRVCHAACC